MPELCKRWRLNIRPITHLHIASGEWLDPTQYVIAANNFYVLNQPRLVSRLNAQNPARLQEMLKLSHDRIAAFLSDSFDPSQADTWTQRHTVEESYQKQYLRDLGNPEAQQLVAAFISNPLTGNPYIPGSSIKGAIRTALVDWRAKDPAARIRRVNGKINDWNLEPILFRYLNDRGKPHIPKDPFKWLKVADCEFSMQSLGLRKVEVRKKNQAMEASRAHPGDELSYLCQVLLKDSEGLSTVISAALPAICSSVDQPGSQPSPCKMPSTIRCMVPERAGALIATMPWYSGRARSAHSLGAGSWRWRSQSVFHMMP